MKRIIWIILACSALAAPAHSITDPDFDLGGSGWTTYAGGSGSVVFGLSNVNFSSNVARLNALVSAQAGIEQEETAFDTLGEEYQLEVQILNTGNIRAGWRDSSAIDSPFLSIWANGATDTRQIRTDDPDFPLVYVEKTGGIGGMIEIESMVVTEITAPPAWVGSSGIISADRASLTSADLVWNQADDNVTPDPQIEYNVYWSLNPGDVITEGVKDTFTGVTNGTITGLPSGASVYFTVRAADRVGNEEANVVQANIGPPPLAAEDWRDYE